MIFFLKKKIEMRLSSVANEPQIVKKMMIFQSEYFFAKNVEHDSVVLSNNIVGMWF